jgi:peptidoglycan hydrolase-like protein with peptidoglycan-binding domain
MSKNTAEKPKKTRWFERTFRKDDPIEPTVFAGGLERMIAMAEALRDINTGGYKGGFLTAIEGWNFDHLLSDHTSCSPFTGTLLGMLYDPTTAVTARKFAPIFDGSKKLPLPHGFYSIHNTSGKKEWPAVKAHLASIGRSPLSGHDDFWGSVGSMELFNLGYEIDPRDMRRGDVVHYDRMDKTGHTVICWDVHMNGRGEVDCFQYFSANSPVGVGISSPTSGDKVLMMKSGEKWHKRPPFDPHFVDRPENVKHCNHRIIPGSGVSAEALKKSGTFIAPPNTFKTDTRWVRAVRLWGFPPPDRATARGQAAWSEKVFAGAFPRAAELARYTQPASYCMGVGRKVQVAVTQLTAVTLKPEVLAKPEDIKRVATRPVQQKPEHVTPEQIEVEHALQDLFTAGLIECGPGDVHNVHDAETVKAVRAFQRRFGLKEDGVAGPVTQTLLFEAATNVRRGVQHPFKPEPARAQPGAPPAAPTPPQRVGPITPIASRIERFYPLQNHARPGEELAFAVEGVGLDVWGHAATRVNLVERTQHTQVAVITPVSFPVGTRGTGKIKLPPEVKAGTSWALSFDAELPTGLTRTESAMVLEVDDRSPETRITQDGAWPWDDRTWPKALRALVRELRETPRPEGPFTDRRVLSTYYVKESLNAIGPRGVKGGFAGGGDMVPILGMKGEVLGRCTKYSLFEADIEGALRCGSRVLSIQKKGRPRGGKAPHRFSEFDPTQSRWHDVTSRKPWGSGSSVPLIPYRVVAVNRAERELYRRKVYIKALDGMRLAPTGEVHNGICIVGDCGDMHKGFHFDFFRGREDVPFKIVSPLGNARNKKGVSLPLSEVALLDFSTTWPPKT